MGLRKDFLLFGNRSIYGITWNLKHPFVNVCFNWMIPNLYMKHGCFTKHPFKTGCFGFQALPKNLQYLVTFGCISATRVFVLIFSSTMGLDKLSNS